MLLQFRYITLLFFCLQSLYATAQIDTSVMEKSKDTIINENSRAISTNKIKDDRLMPLHSPRKAALRSAILPGWGQAYNKQYWKIPIVYAAIGTTAGFFIYNLTNYNRVKYAYTVAYNIQNKLDVIGSPAYNAVDDDLKPIIGFPEALRTYRNSFRQNMDYSALFFILAWGLNVADATVFAHLKSFDVDDNLSLKISPGYSPSANTTGVSLLVYIK